MPVNALALVPSAIANRPTMSICHNSIGVPGLEPAPTDYR
jgi:hypothetical protein